VFMRIKKSQSIAEYSIFIAAVIGGLIVMQVYFQRAVKDNFKTRSDAVGSQFTTTQDYVIEKQSSTLRSTDAGYLADGSTVYWSKSEILNNEADSGIAESGWLGQLTAAGKKLAYEHNEISTTDYVTAAPGSGNVGTHGTFDSGIIATITPWEDAGIE